MTSMVMMVTDTNDSLLLRHLRASASDPVVARASDPRPDVDRSFRMSRAQELRVTITPDAPGDATDQTEVVVEHRDGSWFPSMSCGGSAPACPFTITPSEMAQFGFSRSYGPDTRDFTVSTRSVTRTGLCE